MSDRIYDTVILGGGPAGYTAALYAARAGLDTLVLEKLSAGGQMTSTSQIDNYPGFDEGTDGFTLGFRMQSGAHRFGAATEQTEVISADLCSDPKRIVTDAGEILARTVVIATGAAPRRLGVDEEERLVGRGVGYCAHCDGMLFRGKTVGVIGGGNSAVSDALYLSNICKKVYLIHRRDTLRATKIYHDPIKRAENVEFVWNSTVKELISDKKLTGVVVENTTDGTEREISLDGLFISIGRSPETAMFGGQLELDAQGYITADETTRTSIPGVFAAGDVRAKALRQIVTAASDGAVAAHFAEEYLAAKGK